MTFDDAIALPQPRDRPLDERPEPGPAPDGPSDGTTGAAPATPASRNRRLILAGLLVLTAALLLFAVWYLLTRKPITELPGISLGTIPSYQVSFYGAQDPTGIAVNRDGSRIWVVQSGGDRTVLGYDAAGRQVAALVPPIDGGDHQAVYLALDERTGEVFVADRLAGAVYRYAADGTFNGEFDPGEALRGWQPLGIAVAADGKLLVTDVARGSAHLFGADGSFLMTVGNGAFDFPNGAAFDRKGRIYIADGNNGRLVILSPEGTQVGVVKRGSAADELGLPRGVAVDDQGRIHVVDTTAQGVQVYKPLGSDERTPAYVGRFGVQGVREGAFQYPNDVAVDGRGRVYVTDRLNGRIQVWSY